MDGFLQTLNKESESFLAEPNAMRSLLALLISIIVAFYISKIVAFFIIKIARFIASISDNSPDVERQVKLRRVETYLSVSIAMIKALIVGFVAFYTWKVLNPETSAGAAAIGAGAFFAVLAGGTVGMILRDLTSGAAMIIESWFNVGDYIEIMPFVNISGVVERMTLRSIKLRSLSGEVVWVHNQYVQGVKVTPRGLRTIAIDVFAKNKEAGRKLIDAAIETVPVGTLKVVKAPEVVREEKWGEHLWLFTVVGETAPGREWLMEKYFVESLAELDQRYKGPDIFVRPPIVRFADPEAERSFKRAVIMAKKDAKTK